MKFNLLVNVTSLFVRAELLSHLLSQMLVQAIPGQYYPTTVQ